MAIDDVQPAVPLRIVGLCARFARHFGRSPVLLGPAEIRAYQVYLTTERQLTPASLAVAVAGLRFLYPVTLHDRGWWTS